MFSNVFSCFLIFSYISPILFRKSERNYLSILLISSPRLMENLQELLTDAVFIQLLIFVIFIALSLFSIDKKMQNFDLDAMIIFYCFIAQTCFTTVFSYFSDNACERSAEIGWIAYNIRWYQMPLEQWIFVGFISRRAQKPLSISGAMIFPCSLKTMAKVNYRRNLS